jgi:hypothetical protein
MGISRLLIGKVFLAHIAVEPALDKPGAIAFGNAPGVIGRERIHHHDFIGNGLNAFQTTTQIALLI